MTSITANPTKPNLAGHEKRIGDLETDVCRHEEFIYGNGKIGAKTDIEELKTAVKTMRESLGKAANALWGIAASIIIAVIVWLITVYFPSHMGG